MDFVPPPVLPACLAVWAKRVSTLMPGAPGRAPASTAHSSSSSWAQRRFWGPGGGWLDRSSTCRQGLDSGTVPPRLGSRTSLRARGRVYPGAAQSSQARAGAQEPSQRNSQAWDPGLSCLWWDWEGPISRPCAGLGLTKEGLGSEARTDRGARPRSSDSETRERQGPSRGRLGGRGRMEAGPGEARKGWSRARARTAAGQRTGPARAVKGPIGTRLVLVAESGEGRAAGFLRERGGG